MVNGLTIVQTEINEAEHQLLKKISEKENVTLQELVRKAILLYLNQKEINEQDPLFNPPSAKKGAADGSEKHDEYLYGVEK